MSSKFSLWLEVTEERRRLVGESGKKVDDAFSEDVGQCEYLGCTRRMRATEARLGTPSGHATSGYGCPLTSRSTDLRLLMISWVSDGVDILS